MGKAVEDRTVSAREKIAAQQALARGAERRRRVLIVGGSVIAVIVVVVAFIVIKSLTGSTPKAAGTKTAQTAKTPVTSSVAREIASVPAAALNSVGAGVPYPAKGSVYPHAIHTISPAGRALTANGKPEVVYVGAEYCPFCAAERWALSVALSRFGTLSGLRLIHSSRVDVYPNTPTLSFYKASYTSKYVTFVTTEAQTVSRAPL
jgi:thiol-disulfide isomerase/thioredoxin